MSIYINLYYGIVFPIFIYINPMLLVVTFRPWRSPRSDPTAHFLRAWLSFAFSCPNPGSMWAIFMWKKRNFYRTTYKNKKTTIATQIVLPSGSLT